LPDLTFILGGARSGKSRRAEDIIAGHPPPWTYVATAQAFDDEMRQRIRDHQDRRDGRWTTFDTPLDLEDMLRRQPQGRPVLVDCLTLWLTNVMLAGEDVATRCERLAGVMAQPSGPWVVVANEVGLGIVPDNALARRFRDEAGRLNQMVAKVANNVEFVVADLPMKVK
jgi:adenosylcobinamide kinase/adenosylcobinamide-phosphate guanylyltransferase